jgi:kumamolisin
MEMFNEYVSFLKSDIALPKAMMTGVPDHAEVINVTVRLIPQKSPAGWEKALTGSGKFLTRTQYASQFGASAADLHLVEQFAHAKGLTIVESSAARCCVVLRGTVQAMCDAFNVRMAQYTTSAGNVFRGRSGYIHIPKELEGKIEGIFGLDDRPVATPHFQIKKTKKGTFAPQQTGVSYNPDDIAAMYDYPAGKTGKGQCIALIELGGGYRTADLHAYFNGLKIQVPSVKAVSVDGAANNPGTADGADGEVMLDIEVAGAVSPGAKIVVYFAPNTDQGFLDAITAAIHDKSNHPNVISISWGGPEVNWTQQALTSYDQAFQSAAALGITVTVAAGDSGSSDGVNDGEAHADFPASSPNVLACGGTTITTKGNQIISEVVWNEASGGATGGGISEVFPLPPYQKNAKVPPSVNPGNHIGRGLPDAAANADPNSGYNIRVDGNNLVIGGTSAVAPLMAALITLINENNGSDAGFIHPKIYANPKPFKDITSGNNDTVAGNIGYSAGKGWDACTGWGAADGKKLQALLK